VTLANGLERDESTRPVMNCAGRQSAGVQVQVDRYAQRNDQAEAQWMDGSTMRPLLDGTVEPLICGLCELY